MKFFGIDLGWTTGATGLACLGWHAGELQSIEFGHLVNLDDILQWVDDRLTVDESAVVAVDAPTIISNATGMRDCDRLTHQHFGKYHAGCYPANLGRPFAHRTLSVGHRLEEREFQHAPELETRMPTGRYQLEVFPHAVMLHLFQLNRILKYKKGRLAERRLELVRLRQLILTTFPTLVPFFSHTLNLSTLLPEIPHKGRKMKAVEDQLDSFICAYTAAHWWYWGNQKNWVLGDRTSGYIVVPTPFGPIEKHEPQNVSPKTTDLSSPSP